MGMEWAITGKKPGAGPHNSAYSAVKMPQPRSTQSCAETGSHMSPPLWMKICSGAAVFLVVVIALFFGQGTRIFPCATVVALSALLGFFLLILGAIPYPIIPPRSAFLRWAAIVLLIYVFVMFCFDPNWMVYYQGDILRSIILLVPILLGGVILFPRRLYLSALGSWLILFSWIAALSYNVHDIHGGIGFWACWLD